MSMTIGAPNQLTFANQEYEFIVQYPTSVGLVATSFKVNGSGEVSDTATAYAEFIEAMYDALIAGGIVVYNVSANSCGGATITKDA